MTSVFQPVMTNLLSVLIFLPLAGVLLLVFLPRENHRLLRNVTFAVTLAEFLLSLPVAILFDGSTAAMQFVQNHAWAQELQLSQPALLEKIRCVAGEGKVREIRFTVGSGNRLPAASPDEAESSRGEEGPPAPGEDARNDNFPLVEPSGLEGVRDPETREILRSICRKSSRRKG